MSFCQKEFSISASVELQDLCRRAHGFPDSEEVQCLVSKGAEVFLQCPGYFMPLLHHFILHGKEDCVAACLSTPSPIDFTITRNQQEWTVFHCVAQRNSPEVSQRLLSLLFDRLQNHVEDKVDFNAEDLNFDNFLSSVARYHQLCDLWPYIKERIPLSELIPISLNSAWEDDWNALRKEEQKHFCLTSHRMFQGNEATRKLSTCCRLQGEKVTSNEVDSFIANGADITFRDPDMDYPIFHFFISKGMVDCVISCLNTSKAIDFTVADDWGWTPLHFVCVKRNTAEVASIMMAHIVDRIERSPEDIVSFSSASKDGYDFISCAARYEKLTALWPLVRRIPYFEDKMEPIPLKRPVWRYDWEELGESEQIKFTLAAGMIDASRSTTMLVRECELSGWSPELKKVKELVANGADIFFVDLDMNKPILFHFIVNKMVDVVDICLTHASHTLDFTTTGEFEMTALHCIACCSTCLGDTDSDPSTDTLRMLSLVLHRLSTHPSDTVNWEQKDEHGYDFISYAAYYGNLSSFWDLIKNIPPFSTRTSEIELFLPVDRRDWEKMEGEQKHFRFSSLFSNIIR